MPEISFERVKRLTIALSIVGALAFFAIQGLKAAGGFIVGALLSFGSFGSWVRMAQVLGDLEKPPPMSSTIFLILRYPLIGVAAYVMIRLLDFPPAALITGLLAAFAALLLEILYGWAVSK